MYISIKIDMDLWRMVNGKGEVRYSGYKVRT